MAITNNYLIFGAILSAIAAILHIGCIIFGAPWYHFFGAGEKLAILSEQGSIFPATITSVIVVILFIWSFYALSGAGVIIKLPFLDFGLIAIASIYIVRGVIGFFFITNPMGRNPYFWFWSSIICLAFGLVYLLGIKQIWGSV